MMHDLNNFPKEYDIILDGLENCLTASGNDALTIEVIYKNENKNELKKKKHQEPMKININEDAVIVVSALMNLVSVCPENKEEHEYDSKKTTEGRELAKYATIVVEKESI